MQMLEQEANLTQKLRMAEDSTDDNLPALQAQEPPVQSAADVAVAQAAVAAADANAVHDAVPTTPHQILTACGLMSWQPPAKDSPEEAVRRAQKLEQHMRAVLERARISEGFLSEAMVRNSVAPKHESKHNSLQHQLAKARRSFQLLGQRQSRMDGWKYFAKLVQEHVQGPADTIEDLTILSFSRRMANDPTKSWPFANTPAARFFPPWSRRSTA